MTPTRLTHAAPIIRSELWEEHLKPLLEAERADTLAKMADRYATNTLEELSYLQGGADVLAYLLHLPQSIIPTEDTEEEDARRPQPPARIREWPTSG